MKERYPRDQGRCVSDGGEVLSFLGEPDASRANPLWRAAITSEWSPKIDSAGGDASCRHVQAERGQLSGDLVQVGEHQQQTLRCGEGGGQRPGLQRAVHGACRTAFGLHLDDLGYRSPEVHLFGHRPFIGVLTHR